jgi:hypothetical protein
MSNPVTKERILNSPNFDLVRRNMSEFGCAAFAATTLMSCFGPNGSTFTERFFKARMQRLMRKVVSKGSGIPGQRSLEGGQNLSLFKRFELNRMDKFKLRFPVKYTITVNADRNTVTMDIPQFSTQLLKVPKGAEEFRLVLSVGVLSDFVHQADDGYTPAQPDLDGMNEQVLSPILPCVGGLNAPMQIVSSLAGLPVLPPDSILVVAVGIEFFKTRNNFPLLFAQGNAMKIDSAY